MIVAYELEGPAARAGLIARLWARELLLGTNGNRGLRREGGIPRPRITDLYAEKIRCGFLSRQLILSKKTVEVFGGEAEKS